MAMARSGLLPRQAALARLVLAALPPPPDAMLAFGGDGMDNHGEPIKKEQVALRGKNDKEALGGGGAGGKYRELDGKNGGKYRELGAKNEQRPLGGAKNLLPKPYDPCPDLLTHRRPADDFWYTIWRSTPLVLHDAGLLAAAVRSGVAGGPSEALDLTGAMETILDNHGGPVKYLRLDCSAFPQEDQIERWIQKLSARGVAQLLLFNGTRGGTPCFPLDRLHSPGLTSLALGFVAIGGGGGGGGACFSRFDSLCSLTLMACKFGSQALSGAVCELENLKILKISFSDLTAGGDGFTVVSKSLSWLELLSCICPKLIVQYAPALLRLATGLTASRGDGRAVVFIDIWYSEALRYLDGLDLGGHQLHVKTASTVKIGLRRITALSALRNLTVISLLSAKEVAGLLSFLRHIPRLSDLKIWCLCCLPEDDTLLPQHMAMDTVPCITHCLQRLILGDFRGQPAEVAFVTGMLAVATQLTRVSLHPADEKLTPAAARTRKY